MNVSGYGAKSGLPGIAGMRLLIALLPMLLLVIVLPAMPLLAQPPGTAPESSPPVETPPSDSVTELPMLEDVPRPTMAELLREEPRDWIVTHAGRVLVIPAISPRPDHLDWLLAQQKKLQPLRPQDPVAFEQWQAEVRRFNFITLEVEDNGVEADFRLPTRHIARILYHEDLALELAGEMITQDNLSDARRLISYVAQREFTNNRKRERELLEPLSWPGLIEAQRRLMAAEVRAELQGKQPQQAFQLARFHWTQDPGCEELPALTGEILDAMAPVLIAEQDFRQLRYYLTQFREMTPEQPRIADWSNELLSRAREELRQAEQASRAADERTAALHAWASVNIWPGESDLQRRAAPPRERYPLLRTGLLRNQAIIPAYRHQMLDHEWFTVESIKEGYPRYRSRFVESWVPRELGKSIYVTLRRRQQPFESQPNVSSTELFAELSRATVATGPEERGLFAESVMNIQRESPMELSLLLRDQTPHPLGWLAAVLSQAPAAPASHTLLREGRFRVHLPSTELEQRIPDQRSIRSFASARNINTRYLAEVQDFIHDDPRELLRGLLRDEIDFIPDVPTEYVSRLRDDQRFRVYPYLFPRITAVQFHLRGCLKDQNELRQALLLTLDSKALLEQLVPPDSPAAPFHETATSLTPPGSHAWLPQPVSAEYDPIAARALAVLLLRKPATPRGIRLAVSPEAGARRLAEQIARQWRSLGLEIEILTVDEFSLPEAEDGVPLWDARVMSYHMHAPLHELPALLTDTGRLPPRELQALPLPLRQALLELESSRDWSDVNRALSTLQTQLASNAWMRPLWNSQIFAVGRRELRGPVAPLLTPAQDIDRWSITPVVPRF